MFIYLYGMNPIDFYSPSVSFVISATVQVTVTSNTSTIDIINQVKEATNIDEDMVIIDTKGNRIVNSQGTTGYTTLFFVITFNYLFYFLYST